MRSRRPIVVLLAALGACVLGGAVEAAVAPAYTPIKRTQASRTIVLNGRDMTVDDVVAIARQGARVQLTRGARQRSLNAYYLLLEGSREGIPIYFFNRGAGAGRQEVLFKGDPLSSRVDKDSPTCPDTGKPCSNRDYLLQSSLQTFRGGTSFGEGPPVASEEIVRAMMAERVNSMSYEAATPQVTQMLIDLLNRDVTPVVLSRGSPGEGDLPQMGQVEATMVGAGRAYYHGQLMSARRALARAGLKPLQDQPAAFEAPGAPFAADDAAVTSTNAFTMGQAALLVHDTQQMLNWQDLIYAMELEGMNSSVTPISAPVQDNRPFRWLNGDASRVLNEISGSYLFDIDQLSDTHVPYRIIQDPESLRALSERDGSAWGTWHALSRDLNTQINSSDHNPSVTPGFSPSSSPELDTPWFRQYYVKGGPDNAACKGGGVGPRTGCRHGYVMSNANWDPNPIDNEIEALTNSLANIAVDDDLVPQRFSSTFFTVISDDDPSLPASELTDSAPGSNDDTLADLRSEVQTLQNPVPVQGNAIVSTVEDLQAEGRIKVARARLMVRDVSRLQAQDLLEATKWLNIREIQGRALKLPRTFGAGPTAAWQAWRRIQPWQSAHRSPAPPSSIALAFLLANPAARFYPPAAKPPSGPDRTPVSSRALRSAVSAAPARTQALATSRTADAALRGAAFEPER